MTEPIKLKVRDRVSDGVMKGKVTNVDDWCYSPGHNRIQYVKVSWPDRQETWECRSGLRKLPNRKEGA
jgi:hypothetical protein